MTTGDNGTLNRLVSLSLERCLTRLSKVSAGTWQLAGVSMSSGTVADAVTLQDFEGREAAAVYVYITGDSPSLSFMLFHPEDMDCVSRCFMGYSFSRSGGKITQAEEVMLQELGNIVLNALNNSVMNALVRSFLPSVPGYAGGTRHAIVEALGTVADLTKNFRIITAALSMRSGELSSSTCVLLLLPEELAAALESAAQ